MAGVSADLELQTRQALAAIDEVERALNRALGPLDLDIDTAAMVEEIRAGVAGVTATVDVDADIDPAIADVSADVEEIGREADVTADRVAGIGTSLRQVAGAAAALLAGRELVEFGRESIDIASNLVEQGSAAEVIFGDLSDEVAVFGETSAQAMGLANDQFLESANSIGGLAIGLGLTREEAARLGPELIQRAADVTALRNVTGGTQAVLEAFGSALVGEGEGVRRFGVDISEASVLAKALELGLADANGQIGETEKVAARAAIILDDTAVAAGNYAATSGELAQQQRTLAAEWREAKGQIGEELLPTMLDLVGVAREELVPTLQELGERAAPLFAQAFESAGPAISSTLTILEGLAPVLTLIVGVLDSMPDELLSTVASFVAMRSVLSPLNNALGTTRGSLAGMNPAVFGLGTAFTVLTTILGRNAREAAAHKAQIEALRDSFLDLDQSIREDVTADAAEQFAGIAGELRTAGVSFDDLASAAARGGSAYDDAVTKILLANDETVVGFSEVRQSLEDYDRKLQESAQAAIDQAVSTGQLTEAQADAAEKQAGLVDGATNYFGALELLEPKLGDTAAAEDAAAEAGAGTAGAFEEVKSEAELAAEAVDLFSSSLDATLGNFLSAEEAAIRYRESVREVNEILAEGPRDGESRVQFEDRLSSAMLDTIGAAEAEVEALFRAGEITGGTAEATDRLVLRLLDLANQFPQLRPLIDEALQSIGTLDVEMATQAEQVGEGFGAGLVRGIQNGKEFVRKAAREIAGEVIVVVNQNLQLSSPSRVAYEQGTQYVAGLVAGLEDAAGLVQPAVDDLLAPLTIAPTAVVPAFDVGAHHLSARPGGVETAGSAGTVVQGPLFGAVSFNQPVEPMHFFAEADFRYTEGANR